MTHRIVPPALAFLIMLSLAPASAEIQPVQDSIEAARLFVTQGPPNRVRALDCHACPKRFSLSDDVEVFVGDRPVAAEQWVDHNGKVGSLIYDIESERVMRIRWYP